MRAARGAKDSRANVLGIPWLNVSSMTMIVPVKCITFVMWADDRRPRDRCKPPGFA
jgi:hypothetical protein